MTNQHINAGEYSDKDILSAAPEQLTLMLYSGAISFINESISAAAKNELEKSSDANLRAQNILREFMATLDLQYEVSKNLMSLYEYMEHRLQTADESEYQKNIKQLEEVRTLLTELKDTWAQAMLIK